MKFLHVFFLFLFSLLLISCKPIRQGNTPRDGGTTDTAEGEENFPSIKDFNLDLDEISTKSLAQCAKYRDASSFSIFGGKFPGKQMQSCLAQAVDESLKPLCEHTRELKAAKKHFERKGDEETVERIDEILEQLEEMKYEIGDELYAMADEFDEIKESVLDDIDDHFDKKGDLTLGQTVLKGLGKVVTRSELGGFTRVLDSRARNACVGQLDFSKFGKRK